MQFLEKFRCGKQEHYINIIYLNNCLATRCGIGKNSFTYQASHFNYKNSMRRPLKIHNFHHVWTCGCFNKYSQELTIMWIQSIFLIGIFISQLFCLLLLYIYNRYSIHTILHFFSPCRPLQSNFIFQRYFYIFVCTSREQKTYTYIYNSCIDIWLEVMMGLGRIFSYPRL